MQYVQEGILVITPPLSIAIKEDTSVVEEPWHFLEKPYAVLLTTTSEDR